MDQVDKVINQWLTVRPELDVGTMGPLGRLSRVSKLISTIQEKTFLSNGLNTAGFDVLSTLRRSGPPYALCAGELVASMMITSGTLTNRIDQLEKAGLVRRKSDPQDARRAIVFLTPEGFERIEKGILEHIETQHKLLSVLSKDEVKTLDTLLRKLDNSFQNL